MTMYSSFDYPQTCPIIDKNIGEAKETIKSHLTDCINEICPYIPNEKAEELSNSWGDNLYNGISDCFEAVRKTNEDMRAEANNQIEKLISKVSDLKEQIKELENQVYIND